MERCLFASYVGHLFGDEKMAQQHPLENLKIEAPAFRLMQKSHTISPTGSQQTLKTCTDFMLFSTFSRPYILKHFSYILNPTSSTFIQCHLKTFVVMSDDNLTSASNTLNVALRQTLMIRHKAGSSCNLNRVPS